MNIAGGSARLAIAASRKQSASARCWASASSLRRRQHDLGLGEGEDSADTDPRIESARPVMPVRRLTIQPNHAPLFKLERAPALQRRSILLRQ